MACLRRQRAVQRNKVRLGENLFLRCVLHAEFPLHFRALPEGIVVEHAHIESAAPAGHCLANAPQAEDAECRAPDVPARQQVDPPLLEAASPEVALGLAQSPPSAEDQGERQVRGRIGQHAGRVRNDDSSLGRRRDIDVVESDRDVGDHPHVGHRVHERCVDSISQLADQPVLAPEPLAQVARRQSLVRVVVVQFDTTG